MMQRGPWHQCAFNSQTLVDEQLQAGIGVGAILSARDLKLQHAAHYAARYRGHGADVLLDSQFYVPDFTNTRLGSYSLNSHRASISALHQLTNVQLGSLAQSLRNDISQIPVTAVLAPAVLYDSDSNELLDLNSRLFSVAKSIGDDVGVPTYATVFLGIAATATTESTMRVLGSATSLNADGWYFGFEFPSERLPSSRDRVARCCAAGLTLACTGRPVLHAYAGPMSILSYGFGANGSAISHTRNAWHFNRARFGAPAPGGGGPGGVPPSRFFSAALWGTFVYPDELALMPPAVRPIVLTHSPHSGACGQNPPLAWNNHDSRKHAVRIISDGASALAQFATPRLAANEAVARLQNACSLHAQVSQAGVALRDETASYQGNWASALSDCLTANAEDYSYLEML